MRSPFGCLDDVLFFVISGKLEPPDFLGWFGVKPLLVGLEVKPLLLSTAPCGDKSSEVDLCRWSELIRLGHASSENTPEPELREV
jgi:hypothetical protein